MNQKNHSSDKGYKQTEVGVIPEDWETPELGDILKSMQLGGNYKNSERETSWPLIKMGNLARGCIKLDKLEFIESSQTPASRDKLKEDDVLFNTRNTLDLVGKVAIWRNELAEAYFNSNIMKMKFMEARVSSNRFMNYILNTLQSLKSLRGIAIGTTSVAAIYSRDLVKMKVPLPTKAEQIAIATALSDADALIQSLEKLIAKKRLIKQGAMQKCLNYDSCDLHDDHDLKNQRKNQGNQKNHKNHSSDKWVVKKLGEIATVVMGQSPRSEFYNKNGIGLPLIQGNADVENRKTIIRTYTSSITKKGTKGDIIMSVRAPVGEISKATFDCCLGRGVCAISYKNDYLFHYFIYFEKSWATLSTGSTFDSINSKEVNRLEIPLPPLHEQTRIATILSDMDAEISALETKLAKYKQIKQGMMQELLTGRIRLV